MRDCPGSGTEDFARHELPRGTFAIGVFLFFGATMASLAGVILTWPGTSLDKVWALNPTAHKQLAALGKPAGILFQVMGDIVNCVRGDWLRGGSGFIIAGALLWFLLQPRIRATFA